MRIGLSATTIADPNPSPEDTLALAHHYGLQGVQFTDPTVISRRLEGDRLERFKRRADELGMYVEVGVTSPNPIWQSRYAQREVRADELSSRIYRQLEAASALGCSVVGTFIGDPEDRFRPDVSWSDQMAATRSVLEPLRSTLRDLKIRVAIENHADLTVDELMAFVDALGIEVAGVTLDMGNLVRSLDEPLEATQRLAPLVLASHVKDAVLATNERGVSCQDRPAGAGILPIADLIGLIHKANPQVGLSIELEPGTIDLPIGDPSWVQGFAGRKPEALAAILRMAEACERRFVDGSLERPEDVDCVPWEDRYLDWLAHSLGYLRPIARLIGTL